MLVAATLVFYFILNPEYNAVWIPVLVGMWAYGLWRDLSSTFGRPEMMKYESNVILPSLLERYGPRTGVSIIVACEGAIILAFSTAISRPIMPNITDFAFIAGIVGLWHLYCARSNYSFDPNRPTSPK